MGKVKVKVIGDEQAELDALAEQKKKREEKAAKKANVKGVNLGGGERINTVGVSEEEIAKELETSSEKTSEAQSASGGKEKKARRKVEVRVRSKRHTSNSSMVSAQPYKVNEGIVVLKKFKKSNFDETVELHINVKEKGVSGTVTLPHGTGKKLRIKIADDALIAEVEKGKIDFDILVAEPSMMPKLAKVARVLGPRGLMPNPKAGTITDKPQVAVEKLSAGQTSYKTESGAAVIHASVGKLSFEDKMLSENINALLTSIGETKIDKVVLKSSMSPAVQIQL